MKRTMALWMAGMLLFLTAGCQQIQERTTDYQQLVKDTLAREYSFTAEMRYGNTTAIGTVKKTGTSDLRVEFTDPEPLKGLVVASQGDQIRAEYFGMELDLTSFEIPTQSILNLLREVLAVEHPEGLDVKVEEDTVVASGSIMIASYEIIFQKETMAIEKVTVPSADAELLASDFTFLESSPSS